MKLLFLFYRHAFILLGGLVSLQGLAEASVSRELLPHGNAEMESLLEITGEPLQRTMVAAKEGRHAFRLTEKRTYTLEPLIAVDPTKTYRLSAAFRTEESGKPASANFGLAMYDEQKRHIGICNISPIEDTETHLLHPLKNGDKEAWLQDASTWREPVKHHRIAFQVKSNYSDLPNFQLSPQIEAISQTSEGWKVTFLTPVNSSYRALVAVRQHVAWGAGLYWVANDWIPTDWTVYSTTLTGIHPKGTTKDHFWNGTRYVRIILRLGNWDRVPEEGASLLVDEVSFREVQAPSP